MLKTLRFLIPVAIFAGIGWFLLKGLDRDPRQVPSPLIGKSAPTFSLPQLEQPGSWAPESLRGQVWLLNVWGSWCAACVVEHPLLNELAESKIIPIVGLAWKDVPDNSRAWLRKYGNPYSVIVTDRDGKAAIDWGVYGAPETFLIDRQGVIRYKQIGPFTPEIIRDELMPMIRKYQGR
jgi:cytochrome c biogenesis protein CcmG/thiol:disulfide interchange protein DsbE